MAEKSEGKFSGTATVRWKVSVAVLVAILAGAATWIARMESMAASASAALQHANNHERRLSDMEKVSAVDAAGHKALMELLARIEAENNRSHERIEMELREQRKLMERRLATIDTSERATP